VTSEKQFDAHDFGRKYLKNNQKPVSWKQRRCCTSTHITMNRKLTSLCNNLKIYIGKGNPNSVHKNRPL
jgi:hypothetical protein